MSADNQQERLSNRLQAWYVSGFVDGEGSFHVAIYKDPRMKTGWKIIPEFHVSQRHSSKKVLYKLIEFFDCGYVKENHRTRKEDTTYVYVVRNREDLTSKIIPFFERYSLQTEKQNDFELFKEIMTLVETGKHRDKVGTRRIVRLAFQMNGGGRYRKQSLPIIT